MKGLIDIYYILANDNQLTIELFHVVTDELLSTYRYYMISDYVQQKDFLVWGLMQGLN